ncbi:MAG: bacteriohemerythrin [Treponema sp.]|nr:bacteriohemerythrin [Treponema sp.]
MKDNELITWSSKLSCGIKLIDNQHKELVALVNDMFNHVTGDYSQEAEYFSQIIHKAVRYIKVHFATEERIMLATKFEGYTEHKKKHESFILTVVESINDFKYKRRFSLFYFTKFLKDWVLTHIAVMDKKYFNYLRYIASRKTNGKLSITLADVNRKVS